ncbi:uncharacterized protein LOC113205433 [Frankliniella occidentalis]|uniref:Uncharacterized protein LOC113205433 n=1 Tax=Frankliniella occidentalis TaxID=133901 RepID=A0A9C6TV08_FRAOC|nr:uncharacterized protein LOC113205433 [Frankliniella occidentalis]
MEMLPDDVLLMVLKELKEAADIFACRLVCKRLAAVALDPYVWRGRAVNSTEPYCACPVLRLVPCLEQVHINLPAERCRQWAYASTRCAAAKLWMDVDVQDTSHASHAAAIICRQEMLGRLKQVVIQLVNFKMATDVPMLLSTLASTSRLEKLRVVLDTGTGDDQHPLPATPAPILGSIVVTPSLIKFHCKLCTFMEPFVKFILFEHAVTLERVNLGTSPSSLTLTSIAPLLTGVTNLSKLTCCCLPGMEALAACKALAILRLFVNTDILDQHAVAGVAELLRRAEHLREVSLEYEPALLSVAEVGAELVPALASGRSRVETLFITNFEPGQEENFPLLQPVVSALPSLPALRHLRMDENTDSPDELLLFIRPDVAPALQRVDLNLLEGCVHSWLHGDTVKTVFSANPLLHISLEYVNLVCDDDKRCQACELDCHGELRDSVFVPYFFSHDPKDECSEDHSSDSSNRWFHLPL